MGLKETYNQIIDTYGHNILLIHSDQKVRCSCFNELTQEPDRNCKICMGLGWIPTVDKQIVYTKEITGGITSSTYNRATIGTIGGVYSDQKVYFFKENVKVDDTSQILEVEWADENHPYYANGGLYQVQHVSTLRFTNGLPVYKEAFVQDEPINKKIVAIHAIQSPNIHYEIVNE